MSGAPRPGLLAEAAEPCPRCRQRPGRVGRNGTVGWCYECATEYRRGARMSGAELAESRRRAVERQRETWRRKRAERGLPPAEPKRPRQPRQARRVLDAADLVDANGTALPGYLSAGGALQRMASRTPRVVPAGAHVIEDLHFPASEGPTVCEHGEVERFTRCSCGFRCTGETDEKMKAAWFRHVEWVRHAARRRKAGLVTVAGAHGGTPNVSEQTVDAPAIQT